MEKARVGRRFGRSLFSWAAIDADVRVRIDFIPFEAAPSKNKPDMAQRVRSSLYLPPLPGRVAPPPRSTAARVGMDVKVAPASGSQEEEDYPPCGRAGKRPVGESQEEQPPERLKAPRARPVINHAPRLRRMPESAPLADIDFCGKGRR